MTDRARATTTDDLVPTGLPHGERQNAEEGMRAAGLPKASDRGPEPSPGAPIAAPPQAQPQTAAQTQAFDALTGTAPPRTVGQPAPPNAPSFRDRLAQRAVEMNNQILAEVAALLPKYLDE